MKENMTRQAKPVPETCKPTTVVNCFDNGKWTFNKICNGEGQFLGSYVINPISSGDMQAHNRCELFWQW